MSWKLSTGNALLLQMHSISQTLGRGVGRVSAQHWFAAANRRSLRFGHCVAVAAVAASSFGCGDGMVHCQARECERSDIYVATWWGDPLQGGPASILEDAVEQQPFVDNVHWSPQSATHSELRETLATRVFANPEDNSTEPIVVDAFLANGGWDVLQWTPCGHSPQSQLLPLDDFYPFGSQAVDLDLSVLRSVQCRGQTYAVPIGLHQLNHSIVNWERASRCSAPSAKPRGASSFRDWLKCLRDVASDGTDSAPLVVAYGEARSDGDQGDFGESLQFLVENLMLLDQGATGYESFWRLALPTAAATDSRKLLQGTLQFVSALHEEGLLDFVDSRTKALASLNSGDASAMVMPDWYLSTVQTNSKRPHLAGMTFPGTEELFLYTSDVFAVPRPKDGQARGREPGLRWLDEMLSPQLQNEFAAQKPALPALRNARTNPTGFDRPEQLVPAVSALLPHGPDQLTRRFANWSRLMDESDNTRSAETSLLLRLGEDLHDHLMARFCEYRTEALDQPVQNCLEGGAGSPPYCTPVLPEIPPIVLQLCSAPQ